MAFIDDLNDSANSGWVYPAASQPTLSDEDQWLLYNYPGLTLDQARQAALIAAGLAPRATNGSSGGSSVDHYFDISPTDQFSMDANKRDYDYRVAQDAADAAFRQKQFDYNAGRDAVDDQFRRDQLAQQDRLAQQGYAVDRERIAQQAAAAAADTQARLASVQQQAQAAQLQYQVGMAGAANDAERNRIQAAWNATQAQLAREEYALRDRLTTQQNQIAQYDAETKRAGTMGQLALDTNKFILEKSTSPRDLFGLFMMQRGINPDWDRMAAGQDPGTIAPLVAQDPNGFQFSTPAVSFGPQAQDQPQAGGAAGGQPAVAQPAQQTQQGGGLSFQRGPGLEFQPSPQPQPQPQTGHGRGDNLFGGTPQQVQPFVSNPADELANYAYELAGRDPIRDPQGFAARQAAENGGMERTIFTDYGPEGGQITPRGTVNGVTRMASGGLANDEFFMVGDNWKQNPGADGARPELMWNPTRAPFFVAPNQKNMQEVTNVGRGPAPVDPWAGRYGDLMASVPQQPQKPMSSLNIGSMQNHPTDVLKRPVGQAYDWMRKQDAVQQRTAAMGNDMYRQRMLRDYGAPAAAGTFRPEPMGRPNVSWNPAQMGPGYSIDRGQPQPRQPQAFANAGLSIGANRAQPIAQAPAQAARPLFRRFALGTQEQYEATGNGSLYLPSSTNSNLNTADLPTRLKMLSDRGVPLGPGLVASATGGTAPTLNLGNAVTQGRQAGVLPSLQTLGRQTKSETENTRGYFEGVAGVPWADIVDYLGKSTDFLRSAQVARAV